MPDASLRIDIVCAVPQVFGGIFDTSILGRARAAGLVHIEVHNLHDHAHDRYKHIDDTPYGGGAGMILECGPIFECIEGLQAQRTYDEVIYMCPDGEVLTQTLCNELSLRGNIIILCGHYKGIDQRVRDLLVTREVSIGDYVVTGGEVAAAVLVDAVVRLLPGAISDAESLLEDSFMTGLLEAPHYTRPASFRGHAVPDILLSGNHAAIKEWRHAQALKKTQERRPDLLP